VFYLGVIDRANPFTIVTFHNLGTSPDGYGFDDMTIGTPEQVGPAPAQLQLVRFPQLQIQGTCRRHLPDCLLKHASSYELGNAHEHRPANITLLADRRDCRELAAAVLPRRRH
jgi:hypothetical protein